jgi:hypothetical protein
MFGKHVREERSREELLGRAVRTLPNPQVSLDFNRSIHAALKRAEPNRQIYLWQSLRTALAGLSFSFALTLILLSLFGGSGSINTALNRSITSNDAFSGRSDAVEILVERTNLTSASIRTLLQGPAASQPVRPTEPGNGPAIQRTPSTHLRGA